MQLPPTADVVVVGLGAMGSATTYQLASRGVRVVGIDRFSPPHVMGSTHGDSRVTRQACAEGAEYVPMAMRSHELWREIEHASGEDIFKACGVLMAGPASGGGASLHGTPDWLDRTIELARRFDIDHELLDGAAARERFPAFGFADDDVVYLEPGGGFVRPERAVDAQLRLAERAGASIMRDTLVTSIEASGDGVVVTTDRGSIHAGHVVVSAGAWLPTLLGDADLRELFTVYRQELHWFAVDEQRATDATPDACPVFLWTFDEGTADFFYGFPAIDGPDAGMKVSTEHFVHPTTADDVDRVIDDADAARLYDRCMSGRLPVLTGEHLRSASCLYTMTPDAGFVIAPHPAVPNVTIASPCSGHGFKHSAAIGEAIAQVIVDGGATIDLSPFALNRLTRD